MDERLQFVARRLAGDLHSLSISFDVFSIARRAGDARGLQRFTSFRASCSETVRPAPTDCCGGQKRLQLFFRGAMPDLARKTARVP